MKEVLSFFVGQAGVQISSAFWENFCGDHCIDQTGEFVNCENHLLNGCDRFFTINDDNKCNPRCLLIDLEPTVVDEIKTGSYKTLFSRNNYVNGCEDSASIFARGYFSQGRFLINEISDKIRIQLENCECVQALLFAHSYGGGTGSGLYSLILDELDGYSKILKQETVVYPSFPGGSPVIVEPYNALLVQHYTMESSDITYLVDNDSLLKIANNLLRIEKPTFVHTNRLIAHALGLITSPTRFHIGQSSTLEEMLQNLVPYPRIHSVSVGLGPLVANTTNFEISRTITITKDALTKSNQLLQCDPLASKFMSCCCIYRGQALSVTDIHTSILRLKQKERSLNFVDWCPTGVKVMMCKRSPIFVVDSHLGSSKQCVAIVSNNSCVTDPILYSAFRFQLLFQKRAFIHWYVGEGMEEDEFKDSLENIACLIKDYEECTLNSRMIEPKTQNKKYKDKDIYGQYINKNGIESEQRDKPESTKLEKHNLQISDHSKSSSSSTTKVESGINSKNIHFSNAGFQEQENHKIHINNANKNNISKEQTKAIIVNNHNSYTNSIFTRNSNLTSIPSFSDSIRQI